MAHVAGGHNHTICTTADGSVFTWGDGKLGKLGLGDDGSEKIEPTQVGGKLQNKLDASRSKHLPFNVSTCLLPMTN